MSRKRRGRGESSIYQKTRRWKSGDGYREKTQWVAVVSEGHDAEGGRRRKFIYAATKGEAQAAMEKYRVANGTPGRRDNKTATFADYMAEFLEAKRKRTEGDEPTFALNTVRSYEQVLRVHVVPHLGRMRLDRIGKEHIERLYADLRRAKTPEGKRKTSDSMISRVRVVLRLFFNDAKVRPNPVDEADAPTDTSKKKNRRTVHSLNADQVEALWKAAKGHPLEALFILAATTGMRQGEIFALRWEDLHLPDRIDVKFSVQEIAGKLDLKQPKTGERYVVPSKRAVAALRSREKIAKAEGHGSPHVFTTPDGQLLRKSNFLRRVYYPLRDAAGVPSSLTFHSLRHTAASLLLLQGNSPKVVQEVLGHSDVRLTLSTYSSVLPGLQRQAADSLDVLFSSRAKKRTKARAKK